MAEAFSNNKTGNKRPARFGRVSGWYHRHPEVAIGAVIGLVGGIIISLLILAFVEKATGWAFIGIVSWLLRFLEQIIDSLGKGLH